MPGGSSWRWDASRHPYFSRLSGMQVIENPNAQEGNPVGFAPPPKDKLSSARKSPFPPQIAARRRL